MSRIPTHTLETAPEVTRPVREALVARSPRAGAPINLHAQMAHSPSVLIGYMAMRKALDEHGTFDPKTRAAILLTVADADTCAYTIALNTLIARQAGWTEDETLALCDGTVQDVDSRVGRSPLAAHRLLVASDYDRRLSGYRLRDRRAPLYLLLLVLEWVRCRGSCHSGKAVRNPAYEPVLAGAAGAHVSYSERPAATAASWACAIGRRRSYSRSIRAWSSRTLELRSSSGPYR